jgi:hypothetical protein
VSLRKQLQRKQLESLNLPEASLLAKEEVLRRKRWKEEPVEEELAKQLESLSL